MHEPYSKSCSLNDRRTGAIACFYFQRQGCGPINNSPVAPKVTGEVEMKIIALSCSAPPDGRSRWTLDLLADRSVELKYIDSISYETVRKV